MTSTTLFPSERSCATILRDESQMQTLPPSKSSLLNDEAARIPPHSHNFSTDSESASVREYRNSREASICRLPTEMLSRIFSHCLPDDRIPAPYQDEAPLLLTVICRRWKNVALNSPNLWCNIHLYPSMNYTDWKVPGCSQLWTDGTKRWLERSGALPLSISFNTENLQKFAGSDTEFRYLPILDHLKTLSARWRRIQLNIGKIFIRSLHLLKAEDVPQLEEILITCRSEDVTVQRLLSSTESCSLNQLLCAATLKKLGLFVGGTVVENPSAWGSLTELTLRTIPSSSVGYAYSTDRALSIFQSLPKLQMCCLSILPTHATSVNLRSRPRVYLPALRELKLHIVIRSSLSSSAEELTEEFFKSLDVPMLKSLAIFARHIHSFPVWYRVPFLSLSALDHLESLTMVLPISLEAFIKCLQSVPRLVSLVVFDIRRRVYASLTDSHLALLTPSKTAPVPLCPLLQHIAFPYGDAITESAVLNLAQARIDHRHPGLQRLKSLQVTFCRVAQEDLSMTLEALRKEGLDIQIGYTMSGLRTLHSQDGYIRPWVDEES